MEKDHSLYIGSIIGSGLRGRVLEDDVMLGIAAGSAES